MISKHTVFSLVICLGFLYSSKNLLAAVDPRFDSTTNEQYGVLGEIFFHSKVFPNLNVWGNKHSKNNTKCRKDPSLHQLHVGIDYSSASNGVSLADSKVFSATSGIVKRISRGRACSNADTCLSTLVIYHEKTETSFIYLHLETIDPSLVVGTSVISIGQELGTVGARGRVTGAHLHFEARAVTSEPSVGIKIFGAECIDGTINPFEAVMAALEADSTPCHTLTSGSSLPAGRGAPWNVFSGLHELLLKAFCAKPLVSVEVGPGSSTRYIYNQGYLWNTAKNQWDSFIYDCDAPLISGAWCPGTATAVFASSPPWYVAYTCQLRNNQWKCGCRNTACTQNLWQIQGIRR